LGVSSDRAIIRPMSIAILGSGNVGQALASAFVRHGESVFFGVRDLARHRDAAARIGNGTEIGSVAEAVASSAVVVLAVPYESALAIAAGIPDWQGRILIDATNPLAPKLAGLSVGTSTSGAERIAAVAHRARVVKAFNTTGAENLADARYPGGRPFMPVCGDDADARSQVLAFARMIGFEAVDLGELAAARWLEPFAMTWIHLAIKRGYGRSFAFGLLHRD
jgi:predicted dinucleotide-binding enzyme